MGWPRSTNSRVGTNSGGPFEVFAFLPNRLGFGYAQAPTADQDTLWRFVNKHVDAETPIMSEHLDGGLITGYREDDAVADDHWAGSAESRSEGFAPCLARHPPGIGGASGVPERRP